MRSFARRPVVWLSGVVAAAVSIALTNAMVPWIGAIVDPVFERGPAISVVSVATVRSDTFGRSVIFSRQKMFSEAEIAQLNNASDPVAWLEGRGGVTPDPLIIRLVLVGKRTEPVRILDMKTISTCSDPLDGTLFENPPAGSDESVAINFDLDRTDPEATYTDDKGRERSYFPSRTISLAQNEQQVLQIVVSTSKHFCKFRLRLSFLEGSDTNTMEIPRHANKAFKVTAYVPKSKFETIYLGGVLCPSGYSKADGSYLTGEAMTCEG